jgi:hypothetical protein
MTDKATDKGTAMTRIMVGMKWMMMTAVVIDAVIVEVASILDVVAAWASKGHVLVRGWVPIIFIV